MRCRSPFSLLGLFLLAAPLFVTATAQIPTPVSVLGHNPGDDFYLADYDDAIKYFHALAASSDRIKMFKVGKSTRGEDYRDRRHLLAREPRPPRRIQSHRPQAWPIRAA